MSTNISKGNDMKDEIINNFKQLLGFEWHPDDKQIDALNQLITYAKSKKQTNLQNYKKIFIEAVNNKLELNASAYQEILDYAYKIHIKLNYNQKQTIKELLDSGDKKVFKKFIIDNGIRDINFLSNINPIREDKTFIELKKMISSDKKFQDVIASIFSRYCFRLFDWKTSRECFSKGKVLSDYFTYLETKYHDMCLRNHAMAFVDVPVSLIDDDYEQGCNALLNTIKTIYRNLNNHCEMIVYIPFTEKDKGKQWRLYSDIILYSEKHLKEKIDKTYFRWKKIGDITKSYIETLTPYNAEFDVAFQGFVFKDCFVIGEDKEYALMLVFEKNKRDERIINCPACYSTDIQGNSYPILNVKSWECENPLCPDRSKYNRGKRYAFVSLYRQKQIQEEKNIIPEQSIAKWHLDCIKKCSKNEAFEMAIRHYSCVEDEIDVYATEKLSENLFLERKINYHIIENYESDIINTFKNSSYFYRYLHKDNRAIGKYISCTIGKATIYKGDAYDVLRSLANESIDGAVTSPPYYNAKTYSQWGNIYCYLYDIYNISREVYRVLKNGAVYLFNIFDYFDNENNVSLSAMGDKRMILGAYMIDMFQRIGFRIVGNIIWNKGEIQGNRNFNQGNLTPYYQAPLNCWEHILIFSKGNVSKKYSELLSQIKDIRPVVKMIKGKNTLGHDAPYPMDIPEIIIKNMSKNDIVLDPFLGSGTTSIVANRYEVNSIGIEKSDKYFELCKNRVQEGIKS